MTKPCSLDRETCGAPHCDPWLERRHQEDLERHQIALQHGNVLAVPSALLLCARYDIGPPPWLVREAAKLFLQLLCKELPQGRGRSSNLIKRQFQDNVDFARHGAVVELIEARSRVDRQLSEMRAANSARLEGHIRYAERLRARMGKTYDDAFECVSEDLAGTPAQGSAVAIERSYRKVERICRTPKAIARHQALDWQFESLIGAHVDTICGVNCRL